MRICIIILGVRDICMFKKYIIVILFIFVFGQVGAMKRSLDRAGAIEGPAKKMKVSDSEQRKSLFTFFEENDLEGFKREAEWRGLNDKDSLNERNLFGETILRIVNQSKKIKSDEYFKILLENNIDINDRHLTTGMTILSEAAMDFDFKRMRRALEAGADPNIGSVDGVLPLVYLSSKLEIKFYPKQFEVLDILCSKTDLTKKDSRGNNIMHSRLLQWSVAERGALYGGGDVDVLNATNKKPVQVCWDPKTCGLLESRESVRDQVVAPAMYKIAASQDKARDNFPGMPNNVSKLVFNRQIVGRKDLNLRNLTSVGR